MLAAKSFEPTNDLSAIDRWLGILAEELAERLAVDGLANARRPRNLSLYYRFILLFLLQKHIACCFLAIALYVWPSGRLA